MLKPLTKNIRLLYNRLRRTIHRNSQPKIIIKKFGKPISKSHPFDPTQPNNILDHHHNHYQQNQKHATIINPNIQKHITIATFNAALFSMSPAVSVTPNNNDPAKFSKFQYRINNNNNNYTPKGILKQSPLHPSTNNNASVTKQGMFAKSKLRVSINLPENEISLGKSRRVGFDNDNNKNNRTVLEVLREINADIIALQEVKANEENEMKPLSDLATALGMDYVFAESWAPEFGNAVLSKWPIKNFHVQNFFDHTDFRNVLKTTIDIPHVGEVNFYCTHLDHLDEKWRMKQINAIIESNNEPHILAGGLNSLDECDYSQERWTDIVKYYEDIGKPTPKAEVMKYLKDKQYTDAKDFAGECESVVMIAKGQSVQGTCKYGTRLDYILGSPGLEYKFVPGSYAVISSKGTSDHHIVKVDLIKKESTNSQEKNSRKKQQPKNRVVRITSSSSKGIWSTNMR